MTAPALYIPCYNAAKFLDRVLPAVFAQTLAPSEIVIVDDGSSDATSVIAQTYQSDSPVPFRIVSHGKNKGLAAARNTGVAATNAERIASLDADVVPEPDWLERMTAEMDASGAAGVGGDLMEMICDTLGDRWRCRHMRQGWGPARRERPPFLFGSNTLFTREALRAAGGYDERLRTNAEDVKLCEAIRGSMLLVYTPAARCGHLRADTLGSILRTYWRWHYYGTHTRPTPGKNLKANWKTLKRVGGLLRVDLAEGQADCAAVDVLHLGYSTFMDWRALVGRM